MIISKKTLGVMCLLSICMNLSAEEIKETYKIMQLEKKENMPVPPQMENNKQITKTSITEGVWSFDLITTIEGDKETKTSSITYYSGKKESIVIVPSILGGARVTKISAQAFGHHSEINAVYVPKSVEEVADWSFYDLNTAALISFANPNVKIDDSAFQSSGNAILYLPKGTNQSSAGGKKVVSENTNLIELNLKNPESAIIAGDCYLNVNSINLYEITLDNIKSISVGTESVKDNGNYLEFIGDKYKENEQKVEISEKLNNEIKYSELTKTFKSLTKEQAEQLNKSISKDNSYSYVKTMLNYEEGYYINGNKVLLDSNVKAYDVKTGEEIEKDSTTNLYASTGIGKYKYISYKDTENDGDIDKIYYSPYEINYNYNSVSIKSSNENLNGLKARDTMNPVYLSFANGVVEATGEENNLNIKKLEANTSKTGNKIESLTNEERSILWASDYGNIKVEELQGVSTSKGNWAKMSYEAGLTSYNVEIVMEWGMNALLYATNGGIIKVGNLGGKTSSLYANGDGANGIIAGGTGNKVTDNNESLETSKVYLYNTNLKLEGWNNHVADVVYGGYAYLEKINSTTGVNGSYSVGQASALANDFGNGVVEVKNFETTTYGNRSAGAYVIGGGIITAEDSKFVSKMDAGLVIASGGTFKVKNSETVGQIALRNRGGITEGSTSTFSNVKLKVEKDIDNYTKGDKAKEAYAIWSSISGSSDLIHYMMSDAEMTLGKLCENYNIKGSKKEELLNKLSKISGVKYTDSTKIRNSVLDNTFYNYSAGKYMGDTDFSEVPYLTVGSAFGGLVSSVLEFEASGVNLIFDKSEFENTNAKDYNYLLASEAGAAPVVHFNNSKVDGIIWNEGNVERVVEGRPDGRSSKVTVYFNNSKFEGSFADGKNGLWEVKGLNYVNNNGINTSLNGNYYGAVANWNSTASFDKNSSWIVTNDSYLGSLTIEEGAKIEAKEGYKIKMTVNGKEVTIKAGKYSGEIIIKCIKNK